MSSVSLLHNDNKTSPCPQAGWLPELPQRLPCAGATAGAVGLEPRPPAVARTTPAAATIVSKSCMGSVPRLWRRREVCGGCRLFRLLIGSRLARGMLLRCPLPPAVPLAGWRHPQAIAERRGGRLALLADGS